VTLPSRTRFLLIHAHQVPSVTSEIFAEKLQDKNFWCSLHRARKMECFMYEDIIVSVLQWLPMKWLWWNVTTKMKIHIILS